MNRLVRTLNKLSSHSLLVEVVLTHFTLPIPWLWAVAKAWNRACGSSSFTAAVIRRGWALRCQMLRLPRKNMNPVFTPWICYQMFHASCLQRHEEHSSRCWKGDTLSPRGVAWFIHSFAGHQPVLSSHTTPFLSCICTLSRQLPGICRVVCFGAMI